MIHEAHGPAGIVVSAQTGVGEMLLFEQNARQSPIGLVPLDDERAGWEGPFLDLDLRSRAAHFDALQPENIDDERYPRHVFLTGRNDVTERGLGSARLDRIAALAVKI